MSKIVINEYPKNPKQILVDDGTAITLGIVMSNTGVSEVGGRKIIKAGTPVAGNLKARNTAFTIGTEADAVGVLLHDVDVTAGNENATMVALGCVDLNKLESDVQSLITTNVEGKLSRIIFIK